MLFALESTAHKDSSKGSRPLFSGISVNIRDSALPFSASWVIIELVMRAGERVVRGVFPA